MRKLGLLLTGLGTAVLVSCGAGDSEEPVVDESVAQTQEAIIGNCTLNTFGLPCDPDGPLGPKLECQGKCWYGGTPAGPIFLGLATPSEINGAACASGPGAGDCANSCFNGACIAGAAAAKGAACRPGAASNTCEGACDGAGVCTVVTSPCAFGANNCVFKSCDPTDASICRDSFALSGTEC
ncbi:MAG TPA: hypothetical protein PKD61_33115, partial [Polyangiaceae bacterium]|nr:hypothetical protein [Polyangiaceae bacterium]